MELLVFIHFSFSEKLSIIKSSFLEASWGDEKRGSGQKRERRKKEREGERKKEKVKEGSEKKKRKRVAAAHVRI